MARCLAGLGYLPDLVVLRAVWGCGGLVFILPIDLLFMVTFPIMGYMNTNTSTPFSIFAMIEDMYGGELASEFSHLMSQARNVNNAKTDLQNKLTRTTQDWERGGGIFYNQSIAREAVTLERAIAKYEVVEEHFVELWKSNGCGTAEELQDALMIARQNS